LLVGFYLAATDQSRWHPAFYWYAFVLSAVFYGTLGGRSSERQNAALNACRLLFVGCYLWTGLEKINVTFYFNLFPWMMSAVFPLEAGAGVFSKIAIAIPILEVIAGLFLLSPDYRKIGLALAVGTHIVILALLGPLGHNVNSNVWPWNIAIIFMLLTLFARTPEVQPKAILLPRTWLHSLSFVLFLIMPLFTFFDRWDAYPGFSLYSGSQRAAYFVVGPRARAHLPTEFAQYFDQEGRLVAAQWAMGELNTPDYAEPRIYRQMLKYLCSLASDASEEIELVILSKPGRLSAKRTIEQTLGCPR